MHHSPITISKFQENGHQYALEIAKFKNIDHKNVIMVYLYFHIVIEIKSIKEVIANSIFIFMNGSRDMA